MRTATVYHVIDMRAMMDKPIAMGGLKKVATVNVGFLPLHEALEYVFEKTNNIDSSWSQTPHENVTPEPHGHIGFRSTSTGDVVFIDDVWFFCAPIGWERIEEPK